MENYIKVSPSNKESQLKEKKSKLNIILAMMSFATIGIFVKKINLSSSEIAFWRGVFALITLLVLLIISNRISNIFKLKKSLKKLILSGIAMGFNWVFLFEAYNYTSVALSTLSYYFAPTLITVVSIFIFKEKLSLKQIICFIASTIGLIMIIGVSGGNSSDFIGILYGLLAACLYAPVVLINKATGEVEGLIRTFIQFAAAVAVLFPYVYFTSGFHINKMDSFGFINLVILGVFHTGIVYYLYFNALSYISGQQAAILSYIDPAGAVLLSVIALGEIISKMQLLGGAIILVATFINEVNFKKINSN